ncbi:ArsR family transcriptional regulator [Halomicroarcula laminariae]|uniref:ArsR family transcriptional regulator n=1 Tax=Haloarcula laminariae TaxID=2961577 RepID=UPI0024E0BBD3|nr:ArsR family transcriptional regulator [Halomicroarcula laminariae]
MTIWDDRILELARERDSVSPKELEDSGYFKISRTQISRRLGKLRDHHLLQHLGNGVYIITNRGEQYLDGEISTYEDEPDEVPDTNNGNGPAGTTEPGNAG